MSDIRSALEEAFSKADEAPATTVEATSEPVATVEPTEAEKPVVASDKPRDEAGRFAPKAEKEAPPVEPAPAPAPTGERNPFSSWKPAAQQAFMKAERGEPLTADELKLLKSEAERREADFHKGVSANRIPSAQKPTTQRSPRLNSICRNSGSMRPRPSMR